MSGSDLALRQAVVRIRRGWRRRVLLEGGIRVAAAVVVAVIAGAVLTWLGPGSDSAVTVRVIGYLIIGVALLRYLVVPAFRQPDDRQLALYVEEQAPELRQALVSAVHELDASGSDGHSPGLAGLVVEDALAKIRQLESGPGLERPRVRRAGLALGGIAALAALLVLAGPAIVRDAARVLFIPWSEAAAAPVLAIEVEPGNAAVPRGGAVQVRAALRGFGAEAAELVVRADTGTDWVRLPMQRDSTDGEFTARLFDLVSATEYFIEADGVKSP
ncbi:MAG TPA: hypothetical protein VI383_00405, partial [Gemmatimonadales bacterium]|nr:hypothetical protein [Gemmatimonadales bacterium]